MAMQIEFISDVEGRDLVPVSWNVLTDLRRIIYAFVSDGYEVSGRIFKSGKDWKGSYYAEGRGEKVTFRVASV